MKSVYPPKDYKIDTPLFFVHWTIYAALDQYFTILFRAVVTGFCVTDPSNSHLIICTAGWIYNFDYPNMTLAIYLQSVFSRLSRCFVMDFNRICEDLAGLPWQ